MANVLPYTVFALGDARLHQINTKHGEMFVVGEVAVELFQEGPSAFLREVRRGKYPKINSRDDDVINTVLQLGLPTESTINEAGVALITAEIVEQLLRDRRRLEFVQPFKLALLKLASQEAARLMAAGNYEEALPIALDAVKQGQALFKPPPALQLFPLYLLVAQANLGLKRPKKCQEFLGMSSWLAMREPDLTTNVMRSQLHRLYGQMYAAQSQYDAALKSFAKDVYHSSLEYGPNEVRTSLGYYNIGKVFQTIGRLERAVACFKQVVGIWEKALTIVVLDIHEPSDDATDPPTLPLGRMQLLEVVDMLRDIAAAGSGQSGTDLRSAKAHFAAALALIQIGDVERASEHIQEAKQLWPEDDGERNLMLLHAEKLIQREELEMI